MEKVRIQDDLFNFVNQEWLEKAIIPDDKPTTGGFADLAVGVEDLLISDFLKMAKENVYPNDYLKNAVLLFNALNDVKTRNKKGLKPANKTLNKILKLKNISAFNKKLKEFLLNGLPLPFVVSVDANAKDTLHYAVYIQGPSTILPDVTYYKEEMKAQKEAILGLWSNMVMQLLNEAKISQEEAGKYIADAISFDALLAKYVKSSEEWSDYPAMYNPFKLSKVCSLVKPVKFKKLMSDLFGQLPEQIIVSEPRYFKAFNEVFNENTFEQYKHWAYINELISSCPILSEKLREIGSTYRRALTGIASISKPEKHAYQIASSFYSEPVGLYYGLTYFGEEAKKDVVEMVNEIIDTYKKRIQRNDFLSDETKKKAIVKLSAMKVKMGYPDKADSFFDKLIYNPDLSLYDNICNLQRLNREEMISKLYKDVDRNKWVMPGHMVNACYNPFTNDITFPAAILQAPFYSIKQTRSQNLGGIGAVIGHEISHAFDNNGAKCDENGNLNNWWSKQDFKKFTAKTKAMIKEFEGIELPWGKVNAAFIVSENIADNGGMGVTLEIMSNMNNANYEEYFINWAKVWCMKGKPEYLQLLLSVDVHAPAILRANMQPRNFPEWYKTFNVKKTDKMYISEKKRVVIW